MRAFLACLGRPQGRSPFFYRILNPHPWFLRGVAGSASLLLDIQRDQRYPVSPLMEGVWGSELVSQQVMRESYKSLLSLPEAIRSLRRE